MNSRKSRLILRFMGVGLAMFLLAFPVLAEDDPDPDSPTPILLSEDGSTRALATEKGQLRRGGLARVQSRAFNPNSKITLFVTNLDLMPGEGANAFSVYADDKQGRQYRFPVLDIEPVREQPWIYGLTVLLKDDIGFYDPPAADGDIVLHVAWRGLASNYVRLGLGVIGDNFKDSEVGAPTPYKQFLTRPAADAPKVDAPQPPEYVGYRYAGDRMRFLEQAAFGPSPESDARLRRLGLRVWLGEQFDAPYPNYAYPEFPLMPSNAPLTCNGSSNPNSMPPDPVDDYPNCNRDRYSMYPVQNWFFQQAFYGDAQLRHRVAWALSQIWVTSGVTTQQSRHMLETYKILTRNAFGNYKTLMKEMTLNPGMGNYLDMIRSTKNNPNENYGREILQLFSIGLFMLNQDGSLTNATTPVPTYTQDTVNNFAEVFTGWTACENTALCPNRVAGATNYIDPMLLNQNNHNVTTKTLLDYPGAVNRDIAANLDGNVELNLALDNIFNHPNVAPFVSKILIQHLVTSNPSRAYVGRISAVFRNNGAGVRGDLRAVVRAILLDPEARGNVKTDPNYGKLREPVQYITNLFRAFNVRSADGTQQSDGVVAGLSSAMLQNPFYPPTVFNYYSPDYVVAGVAPTALPAPEFELMTTGSSISRANFINRMVFDRVNVGAPVTPLGTSLDFSEMQALAAADPVGNQLLDALNMKMLHGTMSANMRTSIRTAIAGVPTTSNPANDALARARQAIYLVASSSQYQVQR